MSNRNGPSRTHQFGAGKRARGPTPRRTSMEDADAQTSGPPAVAKKLNVPQFSIFEQVASKEFPMLLYRSLYVFATNGERILGHRESGR